MKDQQKSNPSPGGSPSPSPTPTPGNYNMGINLGAINYYNNSPIYADVTMQMGGSGNSWTETVSGNSHDATLDATGAPTQAAWAGFTADYPTGAYTVSWDGAGSIAFTNGGTANGGTMNAPTVTTVNGIQHNVATWNFTQQPSPKETPLWVKVTATPPLTNIHIMVPAAEQVSGSLFTRQMLDKIQPFTTVRFMDAFNTNGTYGINVYGNPGNPTKDWSQRTWPTKGSRIQPQGMAYEDVIALANQTAKDIWINIPALATDDYVCRLARLLRYGEPGDMNNTACNPTAASSAPNGAVALNTTSLVHVEYANEIWNFAFQQTSDQYCMANGGPQSGAYYPCSVTAPTSAIAAAVLANAAYPWDAGNAYDKGFQMSVVLTKRNNDIFKAVFGTHAAQVKTIFNLQSSYPTDFDYALSSASTFFGGLNTFIDEIAVAPYFNIDDDSYASDLNTLFADIADVFLLNNPNGGQYNNSITNWITMDLVEANKFSIPLVAYEGGEGLSGATNQAVKEAAQDDPRMYAATQTYFGIWNQLVGNSHLFNYFTLSGGDGSYGMWGAVINTSDPGSQKYDALMSLILNVGDANGDGAVDATDCAILKAHYGQSGMWWSEGDFNHDGVVNAADLTLLNQNISGAACTVP